MRTKTLDEAFWEYHNANPGIYELFFRFALQAKNSGRVRYSARAIAHRIRWHTDIETHDPNAPDFKLSNNHVKRYALLLEQRRPDLFAGFFVHRGTTTLTHPKLTLF